MSEPVPEPVIVHRCPCCKRLFDSPSVCMKSGERTVPEPAHATREAFTDPKAWPYATDDERDERDGR